MLVDEVSPPLQAHSIVRTETPDWPKTYNIFGFLVQSDFPLPIAAKQATVGSYPDWRFRRCETGRTPELHWPVVGRIGRAGADVTIRYQCDGSDWLWYQNIGLFHIPSEGGRVDIYPEEGADENAVGFILVGQIAILLLRKVGYPALHASAVQTGCGAVAFLGNHGRGKSTMAACFLRRGATLLTDDILPLRLKDDGVYGGPSLPIMKVWSDTAMGALQISDDLPGLINGYEKRLLTIERRYPFVEHPTRLHALYILQRYSPADAERPAVVMTPISARESMTVLLAQTSGHMLMTPAETCRLLPRYAEIISHIPVKVLSYPNGYEYHDAVYSEVMRALEGV